MPRMAEMVGFEPTERFTAQTISSRSRYDHFDTSPCGSQVFKPDYDIIAYFPKKIKCFLKKNLNFYFALVFFQKVCYTTNKNAHIKKGIN